jgi:hypothetical protein
MNTTTRTDVHSPKNLITEDYELVNCFDNQTAWAITEYGLTISRKLHADDELGRGANQCHHCGAHIRYFAVLEHTPTGKYIVAGETCVDNRFSRATADFQRLRKQAELDRAQQRIKRALEQFAADNSDVAFLATGELPESISWNNFVSDISRKLRMYGEISTRQLTAVRDAIQRAEQQNAERAARKAAEATQITSDVVEGRIEISGEVLSTKWIESQFGSSLKMLVRDARGFKVFGSVPSSISANRGDRVRFVATVERSRDDSQFGFFSRPSKAAVITTAA